MKVYSKRNLNYVLQMLYAAKTLGNMQLLIFLNNCKLSFLSVLPRMAESSMGLSDLMDYSGNHAMSISAMEEEKVTLTTTFQACSSHTSWDAGALVMLPNTDLLAQLIPESVAATP